jgi:hypothetical protein
MPTFALDAALQVELRQPAMEDILHIPFMFSTNGSGVPTLTYDYDGTLTISRSTNTYTLSLGAQYKMLYSAITSPAAVTVTTTFNELVGNAVLAYSGALNSATVHGVLVLDLGQR